MSICVFQGTFNPIHNAHLRVAEFLVDKYCFDKLLFIPAYNPPHKLMNLNLSRHRYNMVQLAVEGDYRFEVSDIEYRRGGKSYTYLTICELRDFYKLRERVNFVIGTDAFENIETWYEFDKLKDLVKFIVFVREDNFNVSKYDYLREKGVEFEFETLSYEDISSTELRSLILEDKDISDYVPKKVEEYIKEHGLYKN